jgi:AraC-like DNA-binding protein
MAECERFKPGHSSAKGRAMEIKRMSPHPALRGIVRSFGERRGTLGRMELSWPLAARPHQIIDIFLQDSMRFRIDGGPLQTSPEEVVVGPQGSRRLQLCVSGNLHIFNISFQPAGLNRLIGIDMTSLVNQGVAVRDVLGEQGTLLNDAVRAAPDFPSRVAAAEQWLGGMMNSSAAEDGIGVASRLLFATRGRIRISSLIERSDLSARHFQRRFTTQVGLPPKLYARTIRFDTALTARRRDPTRTWTDIVHDAGYFDQAHFIRECHALVQAPPSQFTGDWYNIFSPNDFIRPNG